MSSTEISDVVESIAIIGIAGRFPGAKNIQSFWQNLYDGVESISFFSDAELIDSGVPPESLQNPNYLKAGAVLEDIDLFDAAFFGFNPKEAEITDPQHRLFLECAWEALENAGYDSQRCESRIGVYAGASFSNYLSFNLNSDQIGSANSFQKLIGNDKDFLTTRVAYKLNLSGPSVTIQTACSTSLVAINLACQSLLTYQNDMVLAGGVSIRVPQKTGYLYQEGGILSPDGHCRAFDAKAQGTIIGNGVGVVVLKRLSEAIADGDHIYAVIKGTAINNDGSNKIGYTAPSVNGQAEVIAEALALAGVEPESISYLEAHGTGTSLGDPIEIKALNKVFHDSTDKKGFCAIGSVKTNIGHLDAAAGVVGVIKTALALRHKLIPPSLNFEQPNPQIDFANSAFYVNTKLKQWPAGKTPRRAGISSLGIGGTNAHAILEEAPAVSASTPSRPWQLLLLSAKTASALEKASQNLAQYLTQHPQENLANVAYTLQVGRREFDHRRVLVCQDIEDAISALNQQDAQKVLTNFQEPIERSIAFMFPGQGAQYVEMGKELYQTEQIFREQVDYCCLILKPYLGLDLRSLLYPTENQVKAPAKLKQTNITQPALFVIEYALAQLWISWGISPSAMIGHSIGEYVAACLAGVMSLEDALTLVALRGRLMQELPTGTMLSVALKEEEIKTLLNQELSLAACNAPHQCVVSGSHEAIDAFEAQLTAKGLECRRLHTSHAFHSHMMEPILQPFVAEVEKIKLNPPQIPFISNVTGTWITDQQATNPSYWAKHLHQTVRFSAGISELLQEPNRILLEVGPGRTLSTLAKQHSQQAMENVVLPTLHHPLDKQSDVAFILNTLGRLWLAGVTINWSGFYTHQQRQRVPLPTYPFERQRYWIESQKARLDQQKVEDSFEPKPSLEDWFYLPVWKQCIAPMPLQTKDLAKQPSCWLVFVDEVGMGGEFTKLLEQANQNVITVKVGTQFAQLSDSSYILNPQSQNDYHALIKGLQTSEQIPKRIVHFWSVTESHRSFLTIDNIEASQDLGFNSLLFLALAIAEQELTDPLQLWVISNYLCNVTGIETLCPEKATLLGPCRVIPLEFPHIICRCVDVQFKSWQAERLFVQLLTEIIALPSDSIIAYRGLQRWIQTFESIRLAQHPDRNYRLREKGVYLITGGLGSMGLAFAKYLAQTVQAKLVLVGRSALPPKSEWHEWLSNEQQPASLLELQTEVDAINHLEQQIEQELSIKGICGYQGLETTLNQLCLSYIYEYLQSPNTLNFSQGKIYNQDEVQVRLKVLPKFQRFYEFILNFLALNKVIKLNDNRTFEFLQDPETIKQEAEKNYPEFKGIFKLLEHCTSHYSKALSGEIEAISVLYPDGSSELLKESIENTVEYSNSRIYQTLVKEIIVQIVSKLPGKTIKILEVGAGNGLLTWSLATALKDYKVEYYFTDLSKGFILNAEKEARQRGFSFMKFGVFDISKNSQQQGYQKQSFDIILGLDVVHATKNVAKTVQNLNDLLVSNGLLFLIETVKSQCWTDLVWGLAEGWWYFDDGIRTNSPLLSIEKWEELLCQQGFRSVQGYPISEEKRKQTEYGLIIAQQRSEITDANQDAKQKIKHRIEKVKELEELGAEVLVVQTDVSNLEQMQSVKQLVYESFGNIHGVIHTAGILGAGVIPQKTLEMTRRVFAPKVQGTLVLDALFKDINLDFFVFCSSLSSLLPFIGQIDYAAANAFLDAFAHYNTLKTGRFNVSINWGAWQEAGMAGAGAIPLYLQEIREAGIQRGVQLNSNGGIEIFKRILSSYLEPQIVISPEDFQTVSKKYTSLTQTHILEEIRKASLTPDTYSRPNLKTIYVAPSNDIEQEIANIWSLILGMENIGIHDNFFELGGDSLLAIQIVSRIRKTFSIELPFQKFFEISNIAELATFVIEKIAEQTDSETLVKMLAEIEQI
jgi:acyl transferase domain-containing protein/acyl carrier protein/2-polyprenyl-3-methyl-5-hydroxy-6-metoxy-1,4-benzoquinol methylase